MIEFSFHFPIEFSSMFMSSVCLIFAWIVFYFLWKMAPKMVQQVSGNRYFWRHFSKVDFLIHFGRPLSHFGCPLAHLWFPFGSPWLPFGSLWLPFGSLLVPFGSLLVPLGSLLLTLALDVHTFAVSWRHF